jgi:hypothetical protein
MAIEGIRYPVDLQIEKDTDYFKIQVRSYIRNAGLVNGANTKSIESGVADIILPMPSNIQDANTVSWGDEKMNNITSAALNAVQASQDIDFGNLPSSFSDASERIKTAITSSGLTLEEATGLFKKQLAAEAVNIFGANVSIDQILARQSGKIFNPNLELLFNGVTLRDFRFSFKMTPRSKEEKNNVIRIIRTFKKYMAASKGNDKNSKNLYLNTPNVFNLSYMKGAKAHPFLHKFKDCALKGVSVNYTGENVYATYWDGTPISVIIELNFQELTPIYKEEYADPTEANVNLGVGY